MHRAPAWSCSYSWLIPSCFAENPLLRYSSETAIGNETFLPDLAPHGAVVCRQPDAQDTREGLSGRLCLRLQPPWPLAFPAQPLAPFCSAAPADFSWRSL